MDVEKIIKHAESRLRQVDQWRGCVDPHDPDWLTRAAAYSYEAKSLIELLEMELCGSTGGFAPDQPEKTRQSLRARLGFVAAALRVKQHTRKDVMPALLRPGMYAGEQGERKIHEWQADAVAAYLNGGKK